MEANPNQLLRSLTPATKILLTAALSQSILFRISSLDCKFEFLGKAINLSLREKILAEIRTVAVEQNSTLAPLTDDLPLAELGLDSLCFAILVARLEDVTGGDPLSSAGDGRFPRTVGEFITLY